MVKVYESEERTRVIARVKYNSKLDHWDGHNWSDGGTGTHLGITRLRDGRMVLIHGTQWQGQEDYGVVVSDDEALQAILKNNEKELNNWINLKELMEKIIVEEEE